MDQPSPRYFFINKYNTTLATASDSRTTVEIVFQATSMAFILLSGCIGNILILLAIYIDKTLQTVTNSFLVSLACADLLLSLIGMPFTLVSSITYKWIFGPAWCNINGMANSLFCVASILTLAAVSIDRYIAIIHPLRYNSYMTKKTATCMIFYIWAHSLIISLLPVFGWSEYTFLQSEFICTVHWQLDISCTIFIFVVCFFLPLVIMMYTYSRILKTAWYQSKRIVPVTGRISLRGKEIAPADSSTCLREVSDGSLDKHQMSRDTVSTYDHSSQSTDEFLKTRSQQDKKQIKSTSTTFKVTENGFNKSVDTNGIRKISELYTNGSCGDLVTVGLENEPYRIEDETTQEIIGHQRLSNSKTFVNGKITKTTKEGNKEHVKESLLSLQNANNNEHHDNTTSLTLKRKDPKQSVVNSRIVKSNKKRKRCFSEGMALGQQRNEYGSTLISQRQRKDEGKDRSSKEETINDKQCDIGGVRKWHSMDNIVKEKDTMESATGMNGGNEAERSSSTSGTSSFCESIASDNVFLPARNSTEKQEFNEGVEKDLENNNIVAYHIDDIDQKEDKRIIHFQTKARISVVVSSETPKNSPQPAEKRHRRITIASCYPEAIISLKNQPVSSKSTHNTKPRDEQGELVGTRNSDLSKSTPCLQNHAPSQVTLRVEDAQNLIRRKISTWSNGSHASIMALKKKYTNSTSGIMKMKQERKAVRTLLIVVGTFVLCWTPHFIGIFCLISNECSWPDRYFAITTWFAMLNSGCNPVIYGAMSRQFRRRFRQILQCKRGFF